MFYTFLAFLGVGKWNIDGQGGLSDPELDFNATAGVFVWSWFAAPFLERFERRAKGNHP